MNIKKKSDMQLRRIVSMQKQLDKLREENKALRFQNQELLNKETQYKARMELVESIRQEYAKGFAEMNSIKDQYKAAVYDIQQMKKDFAKRFRQALRQLPSQAD